MDAPTLVVVPPSPGSQLSTRSKGQHAYPQIDNSTTAAPNSNSIDTLGSNSYQPSESRSSSENTAVNIYSMYSDGGPDADPRLSYTADTSAKRLVGRGTSSRTNSPPTNMGSPEFRYSTTSSRQNSVHEGVYETQSPMISATTSAPKTSSTTRSAASPITPGESPTGQVIERTGFGQPAILINPPPRRSSRQSLHSNRLSNDRDIDGLSTNSSHHGSSSMPRASLSPTRVSSDPATSATSSSAQSLPKAIIPSPIRPMAPSPGANEDPDSYFVRATYAAFDVSGVRGDGYEEGEELTRARMGTGRNNLPSPLPDTAKRLTMGPKELNEKEVQILGQLDRYGFYAPPSDNRLVLLATQPLRTALSSYKTASTSATPTPPVLPAQPPLHETREGRKTEDRRIAKWGRMLVPASRDSGTNIARWKIEERKERKLEERVFKGIPDRWRSAAWYTLIERGPVGAGKSRGDSSLRAEKLAEEYRDAIDLPSSFDIQIDLDVPRTISGHVMFKTRYGMGQRSMFHVLHSFSLHCDSCGYCQGMGPVAATLLCYLEPEKVYTCLVRLHDDYDMHDIFLPGFKGLLEAFYVQEKIMQKMLPGLYSTFKQNSICTTAYAVKWYITLFANTVPFQTQLRLWDIYFLEGKDILVLMAVAILWVFKDNLLSSSASFESMLNLLSSFYVVEDEDVLMAWLRKAMSDRRLRREMAGWREEWKELVHAGKEMEALI